MPSPIYQYVINLIMSLPIGRGPGVFMNISVWEHRALNNRLFGVDYKVIHQMFMKLFALKLLQCFSTAVGCWNFPYTEERSTLF
jgi:hypothetical protein